MSEAEEVLRGIYEAINTGNLALLEKFVAPGYIEYSEGFQGSSRSGSRSPRSGPRSPTCG